MINKNDISRPLECSMPNKESADLRFLDFFPIANGSFAIPVYIHELYNTTFGSPKITKDEL